MLMYMCSLPRVLADEAHDKDKYRILFVSFSCELYDTVLAFDLFL